MAELRRVPLDEAARRLETARHGVRGFLDRDPVVENAALMTRCLKREDAVAFDDGCGLLGVKPTRHTDLLGYVSVEIGASASLGDFLRLASRLLCFRGFWTTLEVGTPLAPAFMSAGFALTGVLPRSVLRGGRLVDQQVLAIARTLLREPQLVLLDEATANLDPSSETALNQALRAISAERHVLVIAHRMSTVQAADRILVMAGDGIVGRGTHRELYASNEVYRSLADGTLAPPADEVPSVATTERLPAKLAH